MKTRSFIFLEKKKKKNIKEENSFTRYESLKLWVRFRDNRHYSGGYFMP